MKAIRIMLCVVLSLVMALGMVGAYAEPLLDGGVTLSNVVLSLGGEEFALNQQARILASTDGASGALRFELLNGENVLLPISGEIDETGVRFTLDDSGRVYSMDMDMLMQNVAMDEEAAEVGSLFTGMVESGAAALAAIADPANADAAAALIDGMGAALTGNPAQEVEMDINGATYAGVQYKGGASFNSAVAELDIAANSGIEAWDAFVKRILDVFAMELGVEANSFADLKAAMLEMGLTEEEMAEELMDFEMTIGGDETISCMRANIALLTDEEDMDVAIGIEMIATAENIDFTLTADAGNGETDIIEMAFSCSADFSEGQVTAVDLLADCYTGSVYTYDDGYVDSSAVGISFAANAYQEGGLWAGALDAALANEYSFGYEEDLETYSEEVGFAGEMTQSLEEDGSTTAAVALALVYGDETYGLSFDLNCAEGSGLSALVGEGATVYALTDNTEDVAYTLLSADAMGLMADVMELAADETIVKLSEKITEMAMASYEEYAYDEEYSYDDEIYGGDDMAEEITVTTVYSMEEAASIYAGPMPSFTAPAGYELSYVDVSPTDLYAEYVDAEDSYVAFYLMDFGTDLSEAGDEAAYYEDTEGNIVCVEFVHETSYVSFYFDGVTQEEADAVIAGFSF